MTHEPDEVVAELSGDVGVGVRDELDPLVQRRNLGWGREADRRSIGRLLDFFRQKGWCNSLILPEPMCPMKNSSAEV